MKRHQTRMRALLGAVLTALAAPSTVHAHEGAHDLLTAALRPLLGIDHLLAGLLVAGVGAVLIAGAGRLPSGFRRVRRS